MPDSSPDLAKATLRGTFWTYASFYSGKLMVFLSTVILARLLVEEEFGVAGYATVVISFLEVLSDLGIGPALIYHRDNPKARITAFWLNIGIGILLFLVTFFGAPLVGSFFQDPRAVPVTRALALVFPISALGSIHDTLLRKELSFGRKFIPDFVKAISKGLASIILALLGFGAWSLIIGQIVGRALSVVVLWRIMPWRPSFQFAKSLVRPLLSYGLNIVSVDALGITLNNADYLLVGRFLGAAALGVYTVAFRFPDLLVMQFCDVISKVIFPVYARMREDPQALQRGFLTTTRYVSLVTVPMGLGMALVARPLVLAFFTEKWIEAIPVMQAISIYSVMLSLAYNAGDVYKAQGRPIVLTQISILRAIVLIPALLWAILGPGTITAVGWTHAAVAFVSGIFELYIASRMLHTPFQTILATLRPAFVNGALMSAGVLATLTVLNTANHWAQLIASVSVGMAIYSGALWLFHRPLLQGAIETLKAAFKRKSTGAAL
ncbi:MAG TPA: lipopolysaccharide biosynthesis protein [Anaerolineales bacterium]|nr:lipopolysaccharide biosynthesis protein [Anaerolineales bacterium]